MLTFCGWQNISNSSSKTLINAHPPVQLTFDLYRSLSPHQYVNQFPCENMITCKDLLVMVAKRDGETPPWLPLTFNLLYELPRFVKCFAEKQERFVWCVCV